MYTGTCDKLSFDYKTSYEKIHTKYCKIMLGLKKTASNIASNAELGRFPLQIYMKKIFTHDMLLPITYL